MKAKVGHTSRRFASRLAIAFTLSPRDEVGLRECFCILYIASYM